MRMMLKVSVNTADGNAAIKSGKLGEVIGQFMERAKPEAAFFTVDGGQRTGYFFFDMKQSSDMPPMAEDMFMQLGASIWFTPVMNAEELKTGLGAYMSQRK